jgi:hypothetical protein
MKSRILLFFFLLGISVSAFSQIINVLELQKSVKNLSEGLAGSLPFNSSIGLNWADAYIGKVIPSLPPHFGAGLSLGFTTMEEPKIKNFISYLGYDIPGNGDKLFIPAYALEASVGGFFLPFDVGFKFGYVPYMEFLNNSVDVESLLLGADLRFALMDGKSSRTKPNLSLGFGFNYLKGGIGTMSASSSMIRFGNQSFSIENPGVKLLWEAFSLDLKLQISKSILLFTPYLGAGVSYDWSSAGYLINAKIAINGSPIPESSMEYIETFLRLAGIDNMDVSSSGLSSIIDTNAFNARLFGGVSINLFVLKLDLTGLYSFTGNSYGVSIGLRFQL